MSCAHDRRGRTLGLVRQHAVWFAAGALALLAYVPALLSSPGRMPADTKLYLYLDPNRLITDAPWTFDPRQFAGWVPAPGHRLPVAPRPVVLARRRRRAPRLDHAPAVDRQPLPRRRRRRAVARSSLRPRRARRVRRRRRLPAVALPPSVRLTNVGDAPAVGRARLDRRPRRARQPPDPSGATPRCAPSSSPAWVPSMRPPS